MENNSSKTNEICNEILTTCAVNNLRKLTRLVTNSFNEKIRPTGLRTTQVCVMLVIGSAPGKTLSCYVEALGMDLSTLTRSLGTLEKSGLITLKAGHRRERLAHLTKTGAAKIEEVYPLWKEAQHNFIRSFGQKSWQTYLSAADEAGA